MRSKLLITGGLILKCHNAEDTVYPSSSIDDSWEIPRDGGSQKDRRYGYFLHQGNTYMRIRGDP